MWCHHEMGMKTFKSVPYCHQGTKVSVSSGPSNNQRNERGLWCGCSLDYLVLNPRTWHHTCPCSNPALVYLDSSIYSPVQQFSWYTIMLSLIWKKRQYYIILQLVLLSWSSSRPRWSFRLCSIEIIVIIFRINSGAVFYYQLSPDCLHPVSSLVKLIYLL